MGQYLSFALPDLSPELRDALAVLQTSSPPRPFEAIAAVIESELGRPVDSAFRDFERAPVAAASIGQVHRARLPDGTRVAVKVQYPDVAEAVRADLANAAMLVRTVRLLVPGLDAEGVPAELRERLLEELDYRAEARWPCPRRRGPRLGGCAAGRSTGTAAGCATAPGTWACSGPAWTARRW